jgi:ribose/xylose/arabinose/galactoside ABC-type transport system permease subunit
MSDNTTAFSNKLKKGLLSNGFYIVFAVLVIFYSFASKNFLTPLNLRNVLADSTALLVICAGLGLVVITGSLDLSVGSVAFLCAAISASLMKAGYSFWIGFAAALAAGLVIGAINGTLIAYLGFNPLLVTLGFMMSIRGATLHMTKGWQIALPTAVKKTALELTLGVPRFVIFGVLILIVGQIVLSKTVFGRRIVAVGCDPLSSRRVGIPVKRIRFFVFFISGACAAVGGIMSVLNMGVLQPQLGVGMEFIAVAGIVMGGTSLFGGRGSLIPGTLLGVLMLFIIENGLALLSVSPFAYPLVRGVIIFIAMYVDSIKSSRIASV